MVEEVGDADKYGWTALLKTMIGNSSGQMGLTAATRSHEYQPALGIRGEGCGGPISRDEFLLIGRVLALAMQYQSVESETGQGSQVAVGLQPPKAVVIQLLLGTLAWHKLTVIWYT